MTISRMSSTPDLPAMALAMRYPDDIGMVWASMARFHSGAVEKLMGVARTVICFPELTDRPAFLTPWAKRVACNWYETSSQINRDRIREVITEFNIKVVVYISCMGHMLDLHFLRQLGLRTINYEVDSYPTTYQQSGLKWALKRILRGRLKIGVHDLYLANMHHQRRFLLDFAGLPPSRVVTVVNGIDLEKFSPGPRPDPASLNLPVTDNYIVSVCQARPEKRIDVLIDAAAELARTRPDLSATFVHVGGGQCLEEWKAKAERLGLGQRFQFAGGQADVVPYHHLATIYAHPAERESYGYAVVEAMGCGKPVVAARSSGPSELIEADITGILVEIGDSRGMTRALIELLDHPARRDEMGKAGRERATRHYNYRHQALELASVLRKLLPDE